jgi:flagellar basal-body rod protein FlgG
MVVQMHRMDALANDLANVDLTGYKRDISVQKAFPTILLRRMSDDGVHRIPLGSIDVGPVVGELGTGVEQNEVYTVFGQGAMKQTDNDFDLALEGQGFFAIQTPAGERYTRNGSFLITQEGWLVTKEGDLVLGENGPMKLKKNNFVVDEDGVVWQNGLYADDDDRLVSREENEWERTERVDRLRVVDFDERRYLRKQGNSMWSATEESGDPLITGENRARVRQGFLEASNVNPVTAMVEMIEVQRSYEANQRLIQTHDALLGRLINEVIRA